MEIKQGKTQLYIGESESSWIARITLEEKDGVYVIAHTNVDPSLRGQKIGVKLVYAACEKARNDGKLIFPACWYARKIMEENSELSDLIYQGIIDVPNPECEF